MKKRRKLYEPLFEREYKLDTGYEAVGNISMDSPTLEYVIWLEKKLEKSRNFRTNMEFL